MSDELREVTAGGEDVQGADLEAACALLWGVWGGIEDDGPTTTPIGRNLQITGYKAFYTAGFVEEIRTFLKARAALSAAPEPAPAVSDSGWLLVDENMRLIELLGRCFEYIRQLEDGRHLLPFNERVALFDEVEAARTYRMKAAQPIAPAVRDAIMDDLAADAVEEHRRGETRGVHDVAKELGVDLDATRPGQGE